MSSSLLLVFLVSLRDACSPWSYQQRDLSDSLMRAYSKSSDPQVGTFDIKTIRMVFISAKCIRVRYSRFRDVISAQIIQRDPSINSRIIRSSRDALIAMYLRDVYHARSFYYTFVQNHATVAINHMSSNVDIERVAQAIVSDSYITPLFAYCIYTHARALLVSLPLQRGVVTTEFSFSLLRRLSRDCSHANVLDNERECVKSRCE